MSIRSFRGKTPKIASSAYLDPSAVLIGDVEIGPDSSIWPMVVLRGDMNHIRIGQGTSIQDGSVGHITHDSPFFPGGHALSVGNHVIVGHQVLLHGCTIYDHSLIGMQSVILDGAIIESHVMLGAGSLVSPGKTLESGYLYVGRPALKKRKLTQNEIDCMIYSAQNYIKLKDEYLRIR
jgi:carbonic anhydrase/acetyltransferase-like protein (isoleucine patch superfamily)